MPDLYLVGVIVEEVIDPESGAINNHLQIVQHLTVEVGGQARRDIAITGNDLGLIHIGRNVKQRYTASAPGSGASFSQTITIEQRPFGGDRTVVTDDSQSMQLVGRRTSKTYEWSYKTSLWQLGVVRPAVTVRFDDNGTPVERTYYGHRTLVMSPLSLAVVLVIGTLIIGGLVGLCIQTRRVNPRLDKFRRQPPETQEDARE